MSAASDTSHPVELVTGPYRAGKSLDLLGQLVDYLAAAPLQSRPAILTVPSHRYKKLVEERLQELVKQRRRSHNQMNGVEPLAGLFGLKILPFYELCHQMLRQTGQSFRILPDALRPAILEKAIAQVKAAGRLENLAEVAHFPGTHAGILELIDELERAGYAPSEVVTVLAKAAATNSRYMELARIYEAYWQELERLNIYDERKLAYKTREILNKLDGGALSLGFLAVDGFDRFNRLQLQVLSALSEQADRTVVCFDFIDSDEYRWKEKSMRELGEIFGSRLRKIEKAAQHDFAPTAPSMWRSLDRMMEMDEIVRLLKRHLDSGLNPHEAVVVVRSVTPYLTAIKAAFEKAQINYYLDEAVELVSVPLVKYLLRLLKLAQNDFVRQDVVRTLHSPFCNLQFLGLTVADVAKIDDESLVRLVVSGRQDWHWERPELASGANSKSGSGSASLSEQDLHDLDRKLKHFFDRITPPPGALTFTEFVSWVEDLIDDLLVLPNDDEYADPLVVWEENQALFEFRKVLSAFILEENLVGADYGEKPVDFGIMLERLDNALEPANFRRPNASAGAVTVCGADLVPNCKFKTMFIAGLVEGEFPRKGEKTGFLSRDEVRKWKTYDIDIENPRNHDSFEISLYKSLLDRATDNLYISSPLYDVKGDELTPSFFISQGDDNVLARVPYLPANENAVLRPVSSLDMATGVLWYSAANYHENAPQAVTAFLEKLSEPLKVVQARSFLAAQDKSKEWNGDISEQVKIGAVKIDLPPMWSVSRLNDFGKCPFRFWISNLLKVEKLSEPEAGLDAMLLGKLNHKALEYFYTYLNDAGINILAPDQTKVRELFEKSIADAIHWLETENPFKQSEFWQYEKNEIYFRLRRFFDMELERAAKTGGEYLPVLLEKRFGFDEKDETSARPLTIKVGSREIKIRGQIDRADRSQDGKWRVVDYKSGSSRINEIEAIEGRNMQLAIYAMALSRAIEPGAVVSGGNFLSISSGEANGKIDFEKNEQNVLEIVEDNIVRFIGAIAGGNFSVKPTDPNVCKSCDHLQVCRITELKKTGGLDDEDGGAD